MAFETTRTGAGFSGEVCNAMRGDYAVIQTFGVRTYDGAHVL